MVDRLTGDDLTILALTEFVEHYTFGAMVHCPAQALHDHLFALIVEVRASRAENLSLLCNMEDALTRLRALAIAGGHLSVESYANSGLVHLRTRKPSK